MPVNTQTKRLIEVLESFLAYTAAAKSLADIQYAAGLTLQTLREQTAEAEWAAFLSELPVLPN